MGADLIAAERGTAADETLRVLLGTTDGSSVLDAAHRPAVQAWLAQLRADPRIRGIVAAPGAPAALASRYLSRDGRWALIEVQPSASLSLRQVEALARALAVSRPPGPFRALIGGTPAYDSDFEQAMRASLPRVFGFVVLTTLVLLFAAFRSYLLPLKAVLANLLAILAGYGAVVGVCQFGWLHRWIGLERPFAAIPLEVPLMIFCLSFGLSMDYELFLLFRIRRQFLEHGDNERATIEGLSAVAPVITGAGLIMAVVFGAFLSARLPSLKMIGLGLCVAVLIDASVIRALIVPAFMRLAGRWNWYPGQPHRLRRAAPHIGRGAREPASEDVSIQRQWPTDKQSR